MLISAFLTVFSYFGIKALKSNRVSENVVYLHYFGCCCILKSGNQAWKLCLEPVPGETKAEEGGVR